MPYSITTYTRTTGGRSWRISLDLDAYHADLKRAEKYGATVHHWDGEDRRGNPLHVAWIANGPKSVAMRVHEVQHVADAAPRCDTMSCKAPATHLLSWVDDFEQIVNEKVCQSCGEGYVSRPLLKATLKPMEG